MINAHRSNLLRRRTEGDAALRRGAALGGLEGDAAEAICVADRRNRNQKRYVEAEEMIAVDINLEPIHIGDLEYRRENEQDTKQEF